MGGKTNAALTAVRKFLAEQGFPSKLELKRGRKRGDGVEYSALGRIDKKMTKLAKVLYCETDSSVKLVDDYREQLEAGEVLGAHVDLAKIEREEALPAIISRIKKRLKNSLHADVTSLSRSKWPVETFARLQILDACGVIKLVYCVSATDEDDKKRQDAKLNKEQRLHTVIVIWPHNMQPRKVAEKIGDMIVSKILRWIRRDWPKPK